MHSAEFRSQSPILLPLKNMTFVSNLYAENQLIMTNVMLTKALFINYNILK